MAVLPSAIALATIGGTISSGPVNANDVAIQAAVNQLITALSGGSAATPFLTGVGTTLTFAPSPAPPYGLTLPGAPVDGQEAILVDSLTAPTYIWRFRYNAGSASAFKWEFTGGSPRSVEVATLETTTSAAYVDLATVGPSFTIPNAGEYVASFGANGIVAVAAGNLFVALKLGAAAAADTESVSGGTSNAGNAVALFGAFRRTAAVADVWKLQYKVSSVNAHSFSRRELHILPVRVT